MLNEHKKGVKAMKYTAKPKPANPVAKNAGSTTVSSAGAHYQGKDQKKKAKHGEVKHKSKAMDMAEGFNPEYDDEAGMADNNLETLKRAVNGLDNLIQSGDNLPEWCQEKIAVAKNTLVTVWDYMKSEQDAMGQINEYETHTYKDSQGNVWRVDDEGNKDLVSAAPGSSYGNRYRSRYPRRPAMQSSGMYFYNVKPGQENDALAAGLKQTKSGKWYSKYSNPSAEKIFGQGRYWEPKSESVSENTGVEFNGKVVDTSTLEVDGVDRRDHPDYSDAYFSYAAYADGTPLTDDELDRLTDLHGDLVNQMANEKFYESVSETKKKPNATTRHLRDYPVSDKDMAKPVKKPEKKKPEQGVAEMDKSQPSHGRDGKISHSTYGSRDKKGLDYFKGKEAPGKAITAKQASKDALDILKKQGVAEGEGKTQKYEMMMRNGQVKKFVAKDDADAKRIAAGHGAKSVIRLRGGVPAGKVAEEKQKGVDGKACWKGYKRMGTKKKGGRTVDNCVKMESTDWYQLRLSTLLNEQLKK